MRRRKFKGTWFPSASEDAVFDDQQLASFQGTLEAGAATAGAITVFFPVTVDEPQETAIGTAQQLNDVLGQEYALRRIVGKIHIWWASTANGATSGDLYSAQIAAGFFIARASSQDAALPEGATSGGSSGSDPETFNSYSPLAAQTIREPWIWRRTWILGNPPATEGGALQQIQGIVPTSTMMYNSVADGPHIDAKTRRRVRQDERLWFALSGRMVDGGGGSVFQNFNYILDVRMFGALRRARNTGAF